MRGRTLKVRCKNCQGSITLQGPPEEEPEESTRALSLDDVRQLQAAERALAAEALEPAAAGAEADAQWFVMLGTQQQGPFDSTQLQGLVARGELTARSFCWREGMADWKRAGELPELKALLAPPPAARPPAPPRASADLSDLFQEVEDSASDLPVAQQAAPPPVDPFAGLGEAPSLPPPGESTQFFIAQAGVNKRNPLWKFGLLAGGLVGVPLLLLYGLSAFDVVPLTVSRVNEAGVEEQASVFSSEGVSGLKDLLLGNSGRPDPRAPSAIRPAGGSTEPGRVRPAAARPKTVAAAAALYAEDDKKDVGPTVREEADVASADSSSAGGPPPENIARVVGDRQAAFQSCVEAELRKNPNFKGGKVNVSVTVGSSGIVKQVAMDRRDINGGNVGECLRSTARKMVFAAFAGDDVELVIPLVLTSAH